jgi:hypothetical protein
MRPLLLAFVLGACTQTAETPPALRRAEDPWATCGVCDHDAGPTVTDETLGSDPGGADAGAGETAASCISEHVGLTQLLSQLVDLRALARLPSPAYTSHFVSSHNPVSDLASPGDPDWFASRDFVALAEGETATLMDVEGPGAITRIWSASPAGLVRIYIDGADEPAIESDLSELLSGEVEPFVKPFAFVAAYGYNLYFPIPFARGCKVTLTGPTDPVYFHIDYRSYDEETKVESFSGGAVAASACTLDAVAARLRDLEPDSAAADSGKALSFELDASAPDKRAVITAGKGGSVITQLRMVPSALDPDALRSTVLSIEFDHTETVRVPLGDFFASGTALRTIDSVPIGVRPTGELTSRWPMPFETTASIGIEATDGIPQIIRLELLVDDELYTERSLIFHAGWHAADTFASKSSHDWDLALIEGEGLYVGNALNVLNPSIGWWGEGDEKIYIDGESFPSHFGTGTEDYYGYAWCSNQTFTQRYVGQSVSSERESFGAIALHRFHVLDAIAFRRSLRFDLEIAHWGPPVDMTYDALSVWYARPGSRMVNASDDPHVYRVPEFDASPPADAARGPYRCGG